jgi:hypothetical protein
MKAGFQSEIPSLPSLSELHGIIVEYSFIPFIPSITDNHLSQIKYSRNEKLHELMAQRFISEEDIDSACNIPVRFLPTIRLLAYRIGNVLFFM